MEVTQLFQQLQTCACSFCGHDVKITEAYTYTNVCNECLDVLEEE